MRIKPSPPPGHVHVWIGGDHTGLHSYLATDAAVPIERGETGDR